MRRRQTIPTAWLMTDARADALLDEALLRLPRGGGVVFRHHHLPAPARRRRYDQVRAICRRRCLVLVLAGSVQTARAWKADGCHGPGSASRTPFRALIRTMSAHNRREMVQAGRSGCAAVFLSPVFATRSHPGARPLGPLRFGQIARLSATAVIALGGMDARRFERMARLGARGWAAIDAWGR